MRYQSVRPAGPVIGCDGFTLDAQSAAVRIHRTPPKHQYPPLVSRDVSCGRMTEVFLALVVAQGDQVFAEWGA
jgi:hypothetical protein